VPAPPSRDGRLLAEVGQARARRRRVRDRKTPFSLEPVDPALRAEGAASHEPRSVGMRSLRISALEVFVSLVRLSGSQSPDLPASTCSANSSPRGAQISTTCASSGCGLRDLDECLKSSRRDLLREGFHEPGRRRITRGCQGLRPTSSPLIFCRATRMTAS